MCDSADLGDYAMGSLPAIRTWMHGSGYLGEHWSLTQAALVFDSIGLMDVAYLDDIGR